MALLIQVMTYKILLFIAISYTTRVQCQLLAFKRLFFADEQTK